MDYPHLESEPFEAEMALDLLQKALDRCIGTDRAAASALSVGSGHSGLEALLVGMLEQALDGAPMSLAKRAQRLVLGHAVPLSRVRSGGWLRH